MARIAVFGLGYVGITTALGFAELGHSIVGFDVSASKVESLNLGLIPIYEEGLLDSLKSSTDQNLIEFTLDPKAALKGADFVFLCVPTPMKVGGSADLTYVDTALSLIAENLEHQTVIVLKSTLPLGTGNSIKDMFTNLRNPMAYNPEFLREGTALADFRNPDRIIIGADDTNTAAAVAEIYKTIDSPVLLTGFGEAELIKYASNAFLAVKISFINEIAHLAEATKVNISHVSKGIGLDKRIGDKFLNPGPGWGGSCFPKDSRELVTTAANVGVRLGILEAAIAGNEEVKDRIVAHAHNALGSNLSGKRIAVWGLTFKAKTDDIRDSPSVDVIRRLQAAGANVIAFDPVVKSMSIQGVDLAESALGACRGSDLLILMTEWPEFVEENANEVAQSMRNRNLIDTRRILDHSSWERHFKNFIVLGGVS